MILIFARTIFLYCIVLIVMRFMGKREIGQMQPFELVISIMIADLAATPMADIGTPILYGIIPILGLLIMHIIISILNIKSLRVREIICGKPTILINKGKIDQRALMKENYTINELQERLRVNNVFSFSEVEYAILETSGQISIIQKSAKRNLTPEDLNIFPQEENISYDLVIDGKVMKENLQLLNKDEAWLEMELKKHNLKIENTFVAILNPDKTLYYQKKIRKSRRKKA